MDISRWEGFEREVFFQLRKHYDSEPESLLATISDNGVPDNSDIWFVELFNPKEVTIQTYRSWGTPPPVPIRIPVVTPANALANNNPLEPAVLTSTYFYPLTRATSMQVTADAVASTQHNPNTFIAATRRSTRSATVTYLRYVK